MYLGKWTQKKHFIKITVQNMSHVFYYRKNGFSSIMATDKLIICKNSWNIVSLPEKSIGLFLKVWSLCFFQKSVKLNQVS